MIESHPEVKYRIIKEMTCRDKNLLNIVWLCEIAGVSRSGYYRWMNAEPTRIQRDAQDKHDFELILKAYQYRGYDKGARGIYMRLMHEDPPIIMNIKKIRRLMSKNNLFCPIRQANPYRRMMRALRTNKVAENLVERKFIIYGPRRILLTDITYIPRSKGGFSYLSVITDACTRQCLAYACSDSLEVDFVLDTVNHLIKVHGDTLNIGEKTVFHSDQGSHYTSYAVQDLLTDYGLRQSMSRKANCWDNAPQESFFGHMKDEINVKGCTHEEICAIIDDWMDYYSNDRYQWDLQKLSPNEYYEWLTKGVWPLGGSAPAPPEFTAYVFQSDSQPDKKDESGDSSPPPASKNPANRSGRTPALPYPEHG